MENHSVNKLLRPILLIASFIPILLMFSISRGKNILYFSGLVLLMYSIWVFRGKKVIIHNIDNKLAITVTMCIETFSFFDFYCVYYRSGFNVLSGIPIPQYIQIAGIGLCLCSVSFFSLYSISEYFAEVIDILLVRIRKLNKHMLLLLIIYFFSSISLIRANIYYIDDLGRNLNGYNMVGDFSRYFSDYFSKTLHMNGWLADISPFPQFLALFIMAITGVLLISEFFDESVERIPYLCVFALIPLAVNPYFIRCLSYKFDAPYMAFSVFVSVFPIIFLGKKSYFEYASWVFICTLMMCMTYQASSGIFPLVVAFFTLKSVIAKKKIIEVLKTIAYSAIPYVAAMVVFASRIMEKLEEKTTYIESTVSVSSVFDNLIGYFKAIENDSNPIWIVLMLLILATFIIHMVMSAKTNKVIALLLILGAIPVLFAISFGAYIAFDNFYCDPRYMYGFEIMMVLFGMEIVCSARNYIGKVSVIAYALCFCVFFLVYGNAMSYQKEYTLIRTTQIVHDINESCVLDSSNINTLYVTGSIGYDRSVQNLVGEYPVLCRMIPVMLSDSTQWSWGGFEIVNHYGLSVEQEIKNRINEKDATIIKDTSQYLIKTNADVLWVQLK